MKELYRYLQHHLRDNSLEIVHVSSNTHSTQVSTESPASKSHVSLYSTWHFVKTIHLEQMGAAAITRCSDTHDLPTYRIV